MDNITAEQFVEGLDTPSTKSSVTRPGLNYAEIRHEEFRHALGPTKRSFGNAHNKSELRFDYCDAPGYVAEHVTSDGKTKWGAGHGRKYFDVEDHVSPHYEGFRGFEKYTSVEGNKLCHKQKMVPPCVDSTKNKYSDGYIPGDDGSPGMFKSRSHATFTDTVNELFNDDAESEHSNQVGIVGVRRKTDIIRPQSARNRFPQKDFQKEVPRSVTPRPSRTSTIPLKERPGWKK